MAKKKKGISQRQRKKVNLLISQKLQLNALFKKLDKTTDKTERNKLLEKGVDLNTEIQKTNEYLNKFRKKPKQLEYRHKPRKNDFVIVTGKVWEKNKTEDFIFKSGEIKSVNGMEIQEEDSDILHLLNQIYRRMGSNDYLQISINSKKNARVNIVNGKDIDEDEEEIDL